MSAQEKPLAKPEAKAPIFRVRFETYDDFLVEYGDHLRHGKLVLPLVEPMPAGKAVRIKLVLPDGGVLFLTGKTETFESAGLEATAPEGVPVLLKTFNGEQKKVLDRCVSMAARHAEIEQGPLPTSDRPLSLLLVDDSVTVRIELGDALRERSIRVRVAENGLVAIAAALKRPPDVILSDVEMPVMDGWTLLRMIRARKRLAHIPVVFFTRLNDDLSRLQGYRMGVEDYLPKDLPPDEILARLQGVLTRHSRSTKGDVAQGLRGDLEHVRLGSLLSFLEQERRTGELRLLRGQREAVVHMLEGQLLGADLAGEYQRLEDKLFDLLDWAEGEFEFVTGSAEELLSLRDELLASGQRPTAVTYLLMEHARRADEALQ